MFDGIWVLASRHGEGSPATTEARAIDRLGFVVPSAEAATGSLRARAVPVLDGPAAGRTAAKGALVEGPDRVRLAVVEAGFAPFDAAERAAAAAAADPPTPFLAPRTPWGEPDLQGIWTGNSAHGIPLERPANVNAEALTPEEAAARRERGTLGSIWGYEREWRDTTLGYVKTAPSTQVAMVIDPPDGRIPPLTEEGRREAEAARRQAATEETGDGGGRLPAGPEDLSSWVRCITRGMPGMMLPTVYNNGLQIVQGPGFVAIQKEMIHETRVVPTRPRERLGDGLASWLGDPQGRWEGDTLVVETTNFNGRAVFRGASAGMRLIERFTRVAPDVLEYQFTIDDPAIWTRPWTAQFNFDLDNEQYELVEYACHEGNYGMTNILSGARAREKELQDSGRE